MQLTSSERLAFGRTCRKLIDDGFTAVHLASRFECSLVEVSGALDAIARLDNGHHDGIDRAWWSYPSPMLRRLAREGRAEIARAEAHLR